MNRPSKKHSPKKPPKVLTPELRSEYLRFALAALESPPKNRLVMRPEPSGRVVLRFILPIELCRAQNTSERHRPIWAFVNDRKNLLATMTAQLTEQMRAAGMRASRTFHSPLKGRPQILAIRFSAKATDNCANFAKQAIDLLQPSRVRTRKGVQKKAEGLGVIRADDPESVDAQQWWEPAPIGNGFVYLEVRTGEVDP